MNSLMDVQKSKRADTALVISPVPWLLFYIYSPKKLLRHFTCKAEGATSILYGRVKLHRAQELCDFLTENSKEQAAEVSSAEAMGLL